MSELRYFALIENQFGDRKLTNLQDEAPKCLGWSKTHYSERWVASYRIEDDGSVSRLGDDGRCKFCDRVPPEHDRCPSMSVFT
jgi:hypothetical protein